MSKFIYYEPAFLRDIHRNQIENYNKTKSMDISERMDRLVRKADHQARKIGYHIDREVRPLVLAKTCSR